MSDVWLVLASLAAGWIVALLVLDFLYDKPTKGAKR